MLVARDNRSFFLEVPAGGLELGRSAPAEAMLVLCLYFFAALRGLQSKHLGARVENPVKDGPIGEHCDDPQDRLHAVEAADDQEDDPLGAFQKSHFAVFDEGFRTGSGITGQH